MRPQNSAYIPKDGIYPFNGLDYQDPSTLVDAHRSPAMVNMNVDKGHLSKRFGNVALGTAVDGTPLAIVEFEKLDGTQILILITTTKEYKYSAGDWVDVTYTVHAGAIVPRTGTETDGLDYAILTGFDSNGDYVRWLIITNGVDKPRFWDGITSTFWQYSTDAYTDTNPGRGAGMLYTDFVTMKTITSNASYTILGNVTTTANEPNVIVWSDTGSLTNYGTDLTLGAGDSGAIPISDAIGKIQKVITLGDTVMIYADDTIHGMTHIGGNDIFSFQRLISDTRLASSRAIVDISGAHFFLSQEDIYLFDGTRNLLPIAEAVSRQLREEIQPDLKSRAFAFLDKAKNHVYWSIPSGDDNSVIYKMEYNLADIRTLRWTKHIYDKRITAMGFWHRVTTLTWDDASLVGKTYPDMAMRYDQGSLRGGFPQRVLGYEGQVLLSDDTVWTDNGVDVDASYETIDFTAPQGIYLSEWVRWCKLEIELLGENVIVSYSTNRGTDYTVLATQTLTHDWTKYKFDMDVMATTFRIKVQNNGSNGFELRWLRIMTKGSGL